ncbi:YfhO family protein [uncultured Clostridium sp.]|uniref:YfhO family protein n=1 Tax=uncultured Clostridium sp. TaxID=59620 RepID=UPI0026725B90|nr:YfhO family protein [uncultured Clostridium sp.]
MNKKYKNIIIYLIPSTFILIVFGIIYYLKGLFPFGNGSIAWADMYEQQIPLFYKLSDILRTDNSIFYDFSSGMGQNFLGISAYYLISPFSLLTVLIPRNFIPNFMNILLVLKVCLITVSSMFFFQRTFKNLSKWWMYFFSVCYGLCSYTFIMYQLIGYLDFLIIFPLLLLALRRLYDDGNPAYYITLFTIASACNFYVGFMLFLFIIFASFIYLKLYCPKEFIKDRIFKILCSTFFSSLIVLPLTLPSTIQILKSNRVPESITTILNGSPFSYILDKISYFFLIGAILPFIIMLLIKYKENRKFIILTLSTIAFTTIQVIIDGINKLWYMGCYSSFSLNFAFIPTFILIIMAAYYINKYGCRNKNSLKFISLIPITFIFVSAIYYVYKNYYLEIQDTIRTLTLHSNKEVFLILFILFIVCFICYMILFLIAKGKLLYITLSTFFFIQVLFNGLIYICIDSYTPYISEEYNVLNSLYSYDFNDESYFRIKDTFNLFNFNSSYISNKNDLSHFSSLTNKDHMNIMKKLGYSSVWMRTSDVGGTIFSDSLFNIKYVIVDSELSSKYYSHLDSIGSFNIYKNNYFINNGLLLTKGTDTEVIINSKSVFEAQNNLYKALSNDEENLFKEYNSFKLTNLSVTNNEGTYSYEIIDSSSPAYLEVTVNCFNNQLYLNCLKSLDNSQNIEIFNCFKVYINDQLLNCNLSNRFYQSADGTFPSTFNNGLLDLGSYSTEDVTIKLEVLRDFDITELSVGSMDIDKFEKFVFDKTASYSDIITYDNNLICQASANDNNQMLFLTIPYDEGWICTINGNGQPIENVFDGFIGIPLIEGYNYIELAYYPKGFKFGTVTSLSTLTIILFIFLYWVKNGYKINSKLLSISYNLYCLLLTLILFIFYVIPICIFIFRLFS